MAGQGGAGFGGGAAGDLFLEIHFATDARYRLDGVDVTQTLPISPWEAMLGGAIEVETPSGCVQVKIPAESQTGRKLRLKGRGIPAATAGDLYLELKVVLPPADTGRARELYQAMETMARETNFNPRNPI